MRPLPDRREVQVQCRRGRWQERGRFAARALRQSSIRRFPFRFSPRADLRMPGAGVSPALAEFVRAMLPVRAAEPVRLRPRLFFNERPTLVYAVGDPHGCADLYARLEDKIAGDAARHRADAVLVLLGNVVDRGPQTAELIGHLLRPPPASLRRLVLCGNHEQAMIEFLADPSSDHGWLSFGGRQTLASYGIDEVPDSRRALRRLLAQVIPAEHVQFLADLPSLIGFPGLMLAHAGMDEGRTPEMQSEETLLWHRPLTTDRGYRGQMLVHGHTPVFSVDIVGDRINVDTGACFSGKLSAIRIATDGGLRILEAVG